MSRVRVDDTSYIAPPSFFFKCLQILPTFLPLFSCQASGGMYGYDRGIRR